MSLNTAFLARLVLCSNPANMCPHEETSWVLACAQACCLLIVTSSKALWCMVPEQDKIACMYYCMQIVIYSNRPVLISLGKKY